MGGRGNRPLVYKVIENNYGGHHQTLYSGTESKGCEIGCLRCGDADQVTRRNEVIIEQKGKRRKHSRPGREPPNQPTAITALKKKIQLALTSAIRVAANPPSAKGAVGWGTLRIGLITWALRLCR